MSVQQHAISEYIYIFFPQKFSKGPVASQGCYRTQTELLLARNDRMSRRAEMQDGGGGSEHQVTELCPQ